MDARHALIKEAKRLGEIETTKIKNLARERENLCARLDEIDATLGLVRGAAARAASYEPGSRVRPLCPRCAVQKGRTTTLRNIAGTPDDDIWRCNDDSCEDFLVPLRR